MTWHYFQWKTLEKNTTETNPWCHQGAGMAVGWAHPSTGPNQHHKTGTRSPREALLGVCLPGRLESKHPIPSFSCYGNRTGLVKRWRRVMCLTCDISIEWLKVKCTARGRIILLSTNNHPVTPSGGLVHSNRLYYVKPNITIEPFFHSITPMEGDRYWWMTSNWFGVRFNH